MFLDANRFLSKQKLIQDDLGGSKLVLKFNELLHCGSIKCILLQFINIQRKQNLSTNCSSSSQGWQKSEIICKELEILYKNYL